MGKINYINFIFILALFFICSCSPNIGEIQGQKITKSQFIDMLQDNHPDFFQRKSSYIESKLGDWKRLKTNLIYYLNQEAVWIDLQNNNYPQSILPKKQQLYYLKQISIFTQAKIRNDKKIKDILTNNKSISYKDNLLSINKDNSFSFDELQQIYSDKSEQELNKLIQEQIIPAMILAVEGFNRKYDQEPSFKKLWQVKWRWYLIKSYENKQKNQFIKEIESQDEDKLKAYYEKNKKQFGMYPKPSKPNQKREWYQLSYSRAKIDIIHRFAEKKLEDWKNKLREKYQITIDKNYFDTLEKEDNLKLTKPEK